MANCTKCAKFPVVNYKVQLLKRNDITIELFRHVILSYVKISLLSLYVFEENPHHEYYMIVLNPIHRGGFSELTFSPMEKPRKGIKALVWQKIKQISIIYKTKEKFV